MERWRRGTTNIRSAAPPALGRCCGIDVPALPGWAEVWLPPYGPRSDSRSIFDFPHRLFRAGLMFGYQPYGPRSDLRFIARYHTGSSGLGHRWSMMPSAVGAALFR